MNIGQKIEDFIFNKFAGKIITRAAITVAAFAAGPAVEWLAAKTGVRIAVDQGEVQAALIVGAHSAYEWIKKMRMANPNSPAVQTDAAAPCGDKSAVQTVAQVADASKP